MTGRTLSGTLLIFLSAGLAPHSIYVARQPTPQRPYQPGNSMAGLDLRRMLRLRGSESECRYIVWNINDPCGHRLSAGEIKFMHFVGLNSRNEKVHLADDVWIWILPIRCEPSHPCVRVCVCTQWCILPCEIVWGCHWDWMGFNDVNQHVVTHHSIPLISPQDVQWQQTSVVQLMLNDTLTTVEYTKTDVHYMLRFSLFCSWG